MSVAEITGRMEVSGAGWSARLLSGPPLIAPAQQFTFPSAIAGEDDALARGAIWVQVGVRGHSTFLAQCALGFAGGGLPQGLWALPDGALLACAGGYAYAIVPDAPERTVLLPARPAVGIVPLPNRMLLVTYQGLMVRESDGAVWQTPRLSWEGVTVLQANDDAVLGTGWDMPDDVERPFRVNLLERTTTGGGYSPATGSDASSAR